jgi:hypothetical protein
MSVIVRVSASTALSSASSALLSTLTVCWGETGSFRSYRQFEVLLFFIKRTDGQPTATNLVAYPYAIMKCIDLQEEMVDASMD